MSEKKVVGRSVAIALGIICILLVVVGLVGAVAYIMPIIKDKDNKISSLNSEVSDFIGIVTLSKTTVWVNDTTVTQTANNYTSWFFSADYAGYVLVYVQTINENGLYMRTIYNSNADYDNQIGNKTYSANVGTFPILPSTNITIIVGNTNPNGMTGNVTITYFY